MTRERGPSRRKVSHMEWCHSRTEAHKGQKTKPAMLGKTEVPTPSQNVMGTAKPGKSMCKGTEVNSSP